MFKRVWLPALAAVTRVMVRGAGKPGLAKELDDHRAEIVRRFGRVSVVAWIPRDRVCAPLTGPQFGWDCSAFLTQPLRTRDSAVAGDEIEEDRP